MSDYSPDTLSRKWFGQLPHFLEETSRLWKAGKPRKKWLSRKPPERDMDDDEQTPPTDKKELLYHGEVVWGHTARAFFPAYVPGRHAHYGSVVYSLDKHEADSVFELAYLVNRLREPGVIPPPGTETVALAILDDQSSFARLRIPEEAGAFGESYFANLCIHRTRLPGGYLHERLLPILVAPRLTEWCCILPLRFWCPELQALWLDGPPVSPPSKYAGLFERFNIEP